MSVRPSFRERCVAATKKFSQPLLPALAAKRLATIQETKRRSNTEARPSLIAFVQEIAPYLDRFDYFEPYARELECAIGGDLRIVFAAPPQHGKSQLSIRAFLYYARYFPGKRHAYVTYNQTRSRDVSDEFRRIAQEAGFEVTGTLDTVKLSGGTTVKFTSIDSGLTGYAIDGLCLIDDPIKGPAEARSPTVRQACKDFWSGVGRARRHPGTSFVVMATRWHPDDLSGYLVKALGWKYINLKCIATPTDSDDVDEAGRVISDPLHRLAGQSLTDVNGPGAKFRKPPEFFAEEQRDRFWWAAMYQGEPVPQGGTVFHAPGGKDSEGNAIGAGWYRELPKAGYRGAFGLDLAYTEKTSADWSILIRGLVSGGYLYVVDVVRKQVEMPTFLSLLESQKKLHPGFPFRWYAAGTEKGSADIIRRSGIRILAMKPIGDKFMRAQPVARLWNSGKVLLPDPDVIPAIWLAPFLDVVTNFTGIKDDVDDDVDALAAVHDQLMQGSRMAEALRNRAAAKGNETDARS